MTVYGGSFPLHHVFIMRRQEPFVRVFWLWMDLEPVKFEVSFLLHALLFKKHLPNNLRALT